MELCSKGKAFFGEIQEWEETEPSEQAQQGMEKDYLNTKDTSMDYTWNLIMGYKCLTWNINGAKAPQKRKKILFEKVNTIYYLSTRDLH